MPAESTPPPAAAPTGRRWWKWLEPALGIFLFGIAAWILHREVEQVSYQELAAALRALPTRSEVLAILFMVANYLLLTGFDLLAFVYIRKWIAPWRVMAASFVGYAISNNVGFTLLSGTSVRYRFYSRWGLTPGDLSRVVVFYSGTYWVGILLLGGWVLAFDPHPALGDGIRGFLFRALGGVLLLLACAYAVAPFVRREPIRIRQFEIPIPPPKLVFGQFALSTADWFLAASIFYALLPPGGPGFGQVLGAFLAAQLLGLVSHVPGGLGVFEGTMLLLLGARIPTETLLGSLILFRVVYYLIPLVIALLILMGDEVRQRRHQVRRWGSAFGSLALEITPKVQAIFVFGAGATLLFSGVLPSDPERMRQIARIVPFPAMEAAHLGASMVGMALLLVAHGVGRRLRSAYRTTVAALLLGIGLSLLLGGNWEAATILAVVLVGLAPTRGHFDRVVSFWRTRFTVGWGMAVTSMLAFSLWLGYVVHRRATLDLPLGFEFGLHADAPRFLRASAGAALVLLAFMVARRFRPAPAAAPIPTSAELTSAAAVIEAHGGGLANLALLRDKALLWSPDRSAFLMYGVHGRTWVALGDPVGANGAPTSLIRRFVEHADDFFSRPVFYLVSRERLPEYADFGLTVIKVGDEIRVPLADQGGDWIAACRRALHPLDQAGIEFRVLEPGEVAQRIDELREVADEWLAGGGSPEPGFATGSFEPDYVRRFPIAVLERSGRIDAWALLWPDSPRGEIAFDTARHRADTPYHAPEAMLLHLLVWAERDGYRWFSLGIEPLPGLEPLADRGGSTRGGRSPRVNRFDGLHLVDHLPPVIRPVREPRYLAYPGGLALSGILSDVATLVERHPPPAARLPHLP
jgi:phosphatidylglycerol lysyltransferase